MCVFVCVSECERFVHLLFGVFVCDCVLVRMGLCACVFSYLVACVFVCVFVCVGVLVCSCACVYE